MTLSVLPLWGLLAGLAALAALLYLLQRLKPRSPVIGAKTLMFWQKVVEQSPARKLTQQFRNLLSYLLLLLISALLWIAFAGPLWQSNDASDRLIFYLDGSGAMADEADFSQAADRLISDVLASDHPRREVVWGACSGGLLLRAEDHSSALPLRLDSVAPERTPSCLDKWLASFASSVENDETVKVVFYGRARPHPDLLEDLPPSITIQTGFELGELADNNAIVSLGLERAASGLADRVDVLVGVKRADGAAPSGDMLVVQIAGQGVDFAFQSGTAPSSLIIRDVQSDGRLLSVSLKENDGFEADNSASILLPGLQPKRVALSASVPAQIAEIVSLDRTSLIVSTTPDVVVRASGENFYPDLPALEIVASSQQSEAVVFTDPQADQLSPASFGLTNVGLVNQQASNQSLISTRTSDGPVRAVSVWSDLFTSRYNLIDGPGFPIFVSQSLRWLADQDDVFPFQNVGNEPALPSFDAEDPASVQRNSLRALQSLTQASDDDVSVRQPLQIAPSNRSDAARASAAAPADRGMFQSWPDLVLMLGSIGLALLIAEWFLFLRKLVP